MLTKKPSNGMAPEFHFGPENPLKIWVEFIHEEDPWIASFTSANLRSGLTDILIDDQSGTALVVAGGIGYLIDLYRKRLVRKTQDWSPILSIHKTSNPDFIIYSTLNQLYFFQGCDLFRTISLGYVEGVYITGDENDILIGDYKPINTDPFHIRFKVDLNTLEVKRYENILIDRHSHTHYKYAKPISRKFTCIDPDNQFKLN